MNTTNVFVLALPTGPIELCAVVASAEEFSDFIAAMVGLELITEDAAQAFRDTRRVPFISRGKKTEALFQLCGVETRAMSMIVRGEGPRVIAELMAATQPSYAVN